MPPSGPVALDSIGCNSLVDATEETHQDRLAHALPSEDPDLAFLMGVWDWLADECKQRLIEMVRANMPRQCDADEFDKIN